MSEDTLAETAAERADAVLIHIEDSIDKSSTRVHWRGLARGVLGYWLQKFMEEDAGALVHMTDVLAAYKARTSKLQRDNTQLEARVRALEEHVRGGGGKGAG